jgi:hypothetical protein
MLNNLQRSVLRAYGKAQMNLTSYVVLLDGNYRGNREESDWGYIVVSCEEAMRSYRNKIYEVVNWQHPHIIPCWEEYDISEEDFSEYMNRRFPGLLKTPV